MHTHLLITTGMGDVLALCSEEIKGRKRDCLGAGTKL